MNSSNIITTTLIKQASCIQTLSSVCIKRQCLLPSSDAALYGKRFVSSNNDSGSGPSFQDSTNVNRRVNSSPGSDAKRLKSESENELPEEPTDCCMSGCANCVWIQYAEELKNKFFSSDEELRTIIMDKISDPSMKMFLSLELDNLSDESKWRPDDKVKKE
ncbi:uncharacterized protein LOC117649848 [Thrips palmi]|uniref:Uncharacterized protein LOC117649848 n=1 Tax=Thrips palmi TaxID=161013 RepID=A0A6P8ZUW7_THRPL|nr:uncharacterized protein LOC117649848 [Thrips palmi]